MLKNNYNYINFFFFFDYILYIIITKKCSKDIFSEIKKLATLSKVKENIQYLQNKYKNIHKDFGLIYLCISKNIPNDIIDYLLSKYEKK